MGFNLNRCIGLAALCAPFPAGQSPGTTILKQVIIFGRHGVRTPVVPNSTLNTFSAQPFPTFSASGQAVLTPNGQTNETLLGRYFRVWLTQENLLTGKDASDAAFVYVRADNAPLIVDTAQAFVVGLLPRSRPSTGVSAGIRKRSLPPTPLSSHSHVRYCSIILRAPPRCRPPPRVRSTSPQFRSR